MFLDEFHSYIEEKRQCGDEEEIYEDFENFLRSNYQNYFTPLLSKVAFELYQMQVCMEGFLEDHGELDRTVNEWRNDVCETRGYFF